MRLFKITILVFLFSSLSGCFTVKAVNNPEDTACNLVTKELEVHYSEELSAQFMNGLSHSSGQGSGEAYLVLLVAVPATSFIASGSISVIGNVVHWVEIQGKCEDSAIKKFTSTVRESITKAGGMIIDSPAAFLKWFEGL